MKKTVFYNSIFKFIGLGFPAYLFPQNHTSDLVSNQTICGTSPVVYISNNTGEFHTLNSIYKPIDKKAFDSFKKEYKTVDKNNI